MEFRLLPDALEYRESERWVKLGGYINVLARTRSSDQRRSYGILLEWKNRKRPAKAVLTGATGYSAGRATRQGSSSPTRFTGQSAITFSTCRR